MAKGRPLSSPALAMCVTPQPFSTVAHSRHQDYRAEWQNTLLHSIYISDTIMHVTVQHICMNEKNTGWSQAAMAHFGSSTGEDTLASIHSGITIYLTL